MPERRRSLVIAYSSEPYGLITSCSSWEDSAFAVAPSPPWWINLGLKLPRRPPVTAN
jgi:hypothetical protein